MRLRDWGASGTLTLATVAAFHQAITSGVGMWLAYGLAAVTVLFTAGPASQPIARWAFHSRWGTVKMTIAVTVVSVLGAVIIGGLAKWAIDSYRAEQHAAEAKRNEERETRKRQDDLTTALIQANKELTTARQRQDESEQRRERQLARYQIVNARIADLIERGGGIRYTIEDQINAAAREGRFAEFDAAFDNDHREIDRWREEAAQTLDRELPGQRLGRSFSDILGEYGRGHSGFRLTQMKECLNFLRRTQQELKSHIEMLVR